jgi:hypothetical protein
LVASFPKPRLQQFERGLFSFTNCRWDRYFSKPSSTVIPTEAKKTPVVRLNGGIYVFVLTSIQPIPSATLV